MLDSSLNLVQVRWIDGLEISYEERERAEVLLRSEKPLKFFATWTSVLARSGSQ